MTDRFDGFAAGDFASRRLDDLFPFTLSPSSPLHPFSSDPFSSDPLHCSRSDVDAPAGLQAAGHVGLDLPANLDVLLLHQPLRLRPGEAEARPQHGRERLPGFAAIDDKRERRAWVTRQSLPRARPGEPAASRTQCIGGAGAIRGLPSGRIRSLAAGANMTSFRIKTGKRTEFVEITAQVRAAVQDDGLKAGACIVYCPHTTAAITIQENADPDVVHDMLLWLNHHIPKDVDGLSPRGGQQRLAHQEFPGRQFRDRSRGTAASSCSGPGRGSISASSMGRASGRSWCK